MSIRIDPGTLVDPKFLGIPYKLFGETFESCDCIGLAILWFREFGIEYEYEDYKGALNTHWYETSPARLLNAFLTLGDVVHFQDLKKHDCLLLFGNEQCLYPSCIGVMVDDRHFLTTEDGRGSFVAMLNKEWRERFWSAIRMRKVADKWGS